MITLDKSCFVEAGVSVIKIKRNFKCSFIDKSVAAPRGEHGRYKVHSLWGQVDLGSHSSSVID